MSQNRKDFPSFPYKNDENKGRMCSYKVVFTKLPVSLYKKTYVLRWISTGRSTDQISHDLLIKKDHLFQERSGSLKNTHSQFVRT